MGIRLKSTSFTEYFNESACLDMFRSFLRDKLLLSFLLVAVLIKIFSLNEAWVEHYYTYGLYPVISRFLRLLLGWLPVSVGDLLYLCAFLYLVLQTYKMLLILKKRAVAEYLSWVLVKKLLHVVLVIYLVFNLFWGLNYNRQGIASQLGLNVQLYTTEDLVTLTMTLQQRLNQYAAQVDSSRRLALNHNRPLFEGGIAAYGEAKNEWPFLKYQFPCVKPSLFSHIGHYFGFTGYYNPFSGEAQIKTTVPFFLKPFVVTHEIAHQLGYAKENEANFVGFLACRRSKDPEFRYSVYYDMYSYAIRDLYRRDSVKAKGMKESLHLQVKKDNEAVLAYLHRSANPVEPYISAFYDEYLRWNNQPKGKMTYNEVIAWLIAYQKKYGLASI